MPSAHTDTSTRAEAAAALSRANPSPCLATGGFVRAFSRADVCAQAGPGRAGWQLRDTPPVALWGRRLAAAAALALWMMKMVTSGRVQKCI